MYSVLFIYYYTLVLLFVRSDIGKLFQLPTLIFYYDQF